MGNRARHALARPAAICPMFADAPSGTEIRLTSQGVTLQATVAWPNSARGVVLFAHGSGSSRFSPRNRFVAEGLQCAGLATVLLDLLTPQEEDEDRYNQRWRFDIPFLGERLTGAVDWLVQQGMVAPQGHPPLPSPQSIGLFGASTGAAAALITAAARPQAIGAIVSRGGRPDLASWAIPQVQCPTLWIVGGADQEVLALHTQALAPMTAPHRLTVVPGANHLFEEPGALETVTALAKEWFVQHLDCAPSDG